MRSQAGYPGAPTQLDAAALSMARMPEILHAGPVELRRWRQEHVEALVDAIAASLPQLSAWMPWASEAPGQEGYVKVVTEFEAAFDAGTEFAFGMFEPELGVVGGCGLHVRGDPSTTEIGYWVRTDRHRLGYATAAARALTAAAFAHLDEVDQVHITMDEANLASAGVPAKLGYRLDGSEERELLTPGNTGRGLRWIQRRATWSS